MNPKWFNGKDLTSVRNKTSINNPGELSIVIPTPSALKIWKKTSKKYRANSFHLRQQRYIDNCVLRTDNFDKYTPLLVKMSEVKLPLSP